METNTLFNTLALAGFGGSSFAFGVNAALLFSKELDKKITIALVAMTASSTAISGYSCYERFLAEKPKQEPVASSLPIIDAKPLPSCATVICSAPTVLEDQNPNTAKPPVLYAPNP